MQHNLFDFDISKKKITIGFHKGLRGAMVELVRAYKEERGRLKLQKTYKPYWKNIFISECGEFSYEEDCDLKCYYIVNEEKFNGKVLVQYDRREYCAYAYSHYSPYYLNTEVLNFKILEYIPQEEIIENANVY